MIIIIHGENTTQSRAKLNELLDGVKWVKYFSGAKDSLETIIVALSVQELFIDTRTIVIEEASVLQTKRLNELKKNLLPLEKSTEINVFLWNSTSFTPKFLESFSTAKIYAFPLPKYFFQFLDSVMPGQGKPLHVLLFKLYPSFAAEQLLFSLIKRVRQLLMIESGAHVEEIEKMSGWQKGKLSKQAQMWSEKKLIQLYQSLFDLEFRQKTGGLTMSLINHLDILLLTEV